ncbi:DUF192 domain-containing protein [Halorubrum sp. AD140]|uniref:DUF192 domain-containing protein n=1 Tax=Halorubrum sp. AD140 TaxID=3050073 RepID=UPI002ACC497E|nr:DUF192 domain-containing protein [Halorubrum sp. AD140]MDZ5812330.1 DUF192 domain-containing protein [Halorubrum sp. AD140]
MRRRELLTAVGGGSIGTLAGCVGGGPVASEDDGGGDAAEADDWPAGPYADYESTRVEARAADGDALGAVTAAVARTRDERTLGLSDAEALPEDAGMLFVYEASREGMTFVMREMDFGIDIVYADADREITRIHNAPEPGPDEDGSEQRYPGSGQYVLEVPYEWTDRNGVDVGDSLAFEL